MFVSGASQLRFGWHDCQGDIPDTRSVKRALRKDALATHPDKIDGSTAAFLRTQEMRQIAAKLVGELEASDLALISRGGRGSREG